jgi:hypothetical protein
MFEHPGAGGATDAIEGHDAVSPAARIALEILGSHHGVGESRRICGNALAGPMTGGGLPEAIEVVEAGAVDELYSGFATVTADRFGATTDADLDIEPLRHREATVKAGLSGGHMLWLQACQGAHGVEPQGIARSSILLSADASSRTSLRSSQLSAEERMLST